MDQDGVLPKELEVESHGKILGVVPYDLRRPTLARMKERLWNPGDERVVVPRVFGAGWTFNFYQLHEQRPMVFYSFVAGAVIRIALALRRRLKGRG